MRIPKDNNCIQKVHSIKWEHCWMLLKWDVSLAINSMHHLAIYWWLITVVYIFTNWEQVFYFLKNIFILQKLLPLSWFKRTIFSNDFDKIWRVWFYRVVFCFFDICFWCLLESSFNACNNIYFGVALLVWLSS